MMPKLTTPIAEFMHSCNPLSTGPITRDTLTKEELDILQATIRMICDECGAQKVLVTNVSTDILSHSSR